MSVKGSMGYSAEGKGEVDGCVEERRDVDNVKTKIRKNPQKVGWTMLLEKYIRKESTK